MAEETRIRPPSWRDPRLGVGIVLVALAVALGWWIVSSATDRVGVWAATEAITPGDRLAGKVAVVEVDPGIAPLYLAAEAEPNGVADRVIQQGELVPASAVTDAVELRTVVVASSSAIPEGTAAGSRVDIWHTPGGSFGEEPGEPTIVAEDVLVQGVLTDSAFFASQFGGVQVLIEPDGLPALLAAMADDGDLVVVPRGG